MTIARLYRRAIKEWTEWRERRRFFRAFPDAEVNYRQQKKCRRLHRRGASDAIKRNYDSTHAALRAENEMVGA